MAQGPPSGPNPVVVASTQPYWASSIPPLAGAARRRPLEEGGRTHPGHGATRLVVPPPTLTGAAGAARSKGKGGTPSQVGQRRAGGLPSD